MVNHIFYLDGAAVGGTVSTLLSSPFLSRPDDFLLVIKASAAIQTMTGRPHDPAEIEIASYTYMYHRTIRMFVGSHPQAKAFVFSTIVFLAR